MNPIKYRGLHFWLDDGNTQYQLRVWRGCRGGTLRTVVNDRVDKTKTKVIRFKGLTYSAAWETLRAYANGQ